ncbi:pheromone-processing carboxypeptidase KEX1-like [Papaver somniferum]|uniref:pheromone-processing carboxypeptidase KEX1-like n=1 Tax=Papaver somniferum TaxID=3469 RepID=UPI000E6F4BF7|nr:pheromone-processing carboxypeptidase KEX1-like [Papaver somniferum]
MNTPEKTRVSKTPSVPVRRRPRLKGKGVKNSTSKNLFGETGGSSTKPVVLDSDEDVEMRAGQDEDIENRQSDEDIEDVGVVNHDYWVNKAMLDREMGDAQADEYVVELDNICEDECNPVEDPDATPIYDSDEDSDCMKYDSEEDSADSNDDAKEDSGDSSDDGEQNNDEGDVENKDDDPEWFRNFKDERALNFPDEVIEQGDNGRDKGKHNGGTTEMKDDDPEWLKNFKDERLMTFPEEEVIEEEEEEFFPDQ